MAGVKDFEAVVKDLDALLRDPEEKNQSIARVESQKASPFLALPAEIRNDISNMVVGPANTDLSRCWEGGRNLRSPPLSRVNRQLRSEVLRMFYEGNEFYANLVCRNDGDHEYWHLYALLTPIIAQPIIQSIKTLRLKFGNVKTPFGVLYELAIDFCDGPRAYGPWDEDDWVPIPHPETSYRFPRIGKETWTASITIGPWRYAWMGAIGGDKLNWKDLNAVRRAVDVKIEHNIQHYLDNIGEQPSQCLDEKKEYTLGVGNRPIQHIDRVTECVFSVAQHFRNTRKFMYFMNKRGRNWREDLVKGGRLVVPPGSPYAYKEYMESAWRNHERIMRGDYPPVFKSLEEHEMAQRLSYARHNPGCGNH